MMPLRPGKIIGIGRNYVEHARELGNEMPAVPIIFFKPATALLGPGETILLPSASQRVEFEGEIGIVIGKRIRHADVSAAERAIGGFTCVNDVTCRDLQQVDGQWGRAKGFDTFCPVGPLVADEIDPWAGVRVETRVNGDVRQDGNTRDFIFPLDVILRHITDCMTLFPGDLIATGTPKGVGPVVAGDVVEITVEGIGTLRNPIAEED